MFVIILILACDTSLLPEPMTEAVSYKLYGMKLW